MTINYTLLSFLLLFVASANAQLTIVDERGQAMEFVLAQNQDLIRHAHSDQNGKINLLSFEVNDTLSLQHLGYKTISYPVKNRNASETLELEPSALLLETIAVDASEPLDKLSQLDLLLRPVLNSQKILQVVPGLFIGQHAGGGKAEQIFLRGFDIDHGTDLNMTVEDMPVNMVSHAHGQGYADLHFVIPESVEGIDYGKGPYQANQGNFATAGHINYALKDQLDQSFVSVEAGQFGLRRYATGLQLINKPTQKLYLMGEALQNDGPFISSQNLTRNNLLARYNADLPNKQNLSLTASYFSSNWDASGQIPIRAVNNNIITRFGAIDDTEGGKTTRSNFMIKHKTPLSKRSYLTTNAYYSAYTFDLFSNFTFFLEDPINGDQIRQQETRDLFGGQTKYSYSFGRTSPALLTIGLGFRSDRVNDVSLSKTLNRTTVITALADGDVKEDNYFAFAELEYNFGKLSITPSIRIDEFSFNYENQLTPQVEPTSARSLQLSPKLITSYQLNASTGFYAKIGRGFHANDSRAILAGRVDQMLPAAHGADLGAIVKLADHTLINAGLWGLISDQEFVYVGDAGIVEPSGKSRRAGVDLSIRSQFANRLLGDLDYTYAHARAIGEEEGSAFIPLAPVHTLTSGITYQSEKLNAGIRTRMLSDRAANEDNSITAKGYTILDGNFSYAIGKVTLGLSLENILNADWREAQFATESRLFDEAESVEEIHFTPGNPRNIRGSVRFNF